MTILMWLESYIFNSYIRRKENGKILLVEDEEMLNGITAKYLRAENMTVDTLLQWSTSHRLCKYI